LAALAHKVKTLTDHNSVNNDASKVGQKLY